MNDIQAASTHDAAAASLAVGKTRRLLGWIVLAAVVVGTAFAVQHEWATFSATLRDIGVVPTVLALGFAVLGVSATEPVWSTLMRGLGLHVPRLPGARVFFLSQLGKYLPGAVWPVVIQAETLAGRGAGRRTVVTGNLLTLALHLLVGIALGALLLTVYEPEVVRRYWWALLTLPALLALLHPRLLPWVIDRGLQVLGRPPVHDRVEPRAVAVASAWSLASWGLLGAHMFVLVAATGHDTASALWLSIGATAVAICAGVLFLPAPAGTGVRELVLVLALAPLLGAGAALAVAVASRVLLLTADIVLAGAASLTLLTGHQPRGR